MLQIEKIDSEDISRQVVILIFTVVEVLYRDKIISKETFDACKKVCEKELQHEWKELEPKLRAKAEMHRVKKVGLEN